MADFHGLDLAAYNCTARRGELHDILNGHKRLKGFGVLFLGVPLPPEYADLLQTLAPLVAVGNFKHHNLVGLLGV